MVILKGGEVSQNILEIVCLEGIENALGAFFIVRAIFFQEKINLAFQVGGILSDQHGVLAPSPPGFPVAV